MALRTVNKLTEEETRDFVIKYNEMHFTTVALPSIKPNCSQIHHLFIELSNTQDTASRRMLVPTFEQTTPSLYLSLLTQKHYVPRMSTGIENSGKKFHLSLAILLHQHWVPSGRGSAQTR